jgi:hypothetical protein
MISPAGLQKPPALADLCRVSVMEQYSIGQSQCFGQNIHSIKISEFKSLTFIKVIIFVTIADS